ncbi:hypothetical protein FOXG_14459 [Fusarium oxysporum f. sp. lycopersici 4287]|uniref:Major facilitator superfamily (MFS) profile domain-containing protein n=3 Tax=Fusarium oxysporum TaxID=5507 RepID=A0A0J9WTU5_FUSO4|nr:hypothetical protein FOXG_14459 [Fusarium oxysporum f. sp. lycopersici 4287]KNB16642.1 hypothetical protein FOXG_14459 [Fusarium oxysporum f. sp. lycopersici 4287]
MPSVTSPPPTVGADQKATQAPGHLPARTYLGGQTQRNNTANATMDSAKETAKETFHKVIHPSMDPSKNTQQPASTGLERDLEPKPQKVHLPSEGEDIVYTPSGKLAGKKAFITGGVSGIGRAVAILFAMEGATVAIVYLPPEEEDAQHTKTQVEKNGGQVILIPSDLSLSINCKDVAKRAVEALGGIDIFVNNAATRQEQGDICDISEELWASTFRVNLDSYFHLTKYVLPHLSKGGVIINSLATYTDAIVTLWPSQLQKLESLGLYYNSPEPAIICIECSFAINPTRAPRHPGDKHHIPKSARRGLKPLIYSLNLPNPETLPLRPNGSPPHPNLTAMTRLRVEEAKRSVERLQSKGTTVNADETVAMMIHTDQVERKISEGTGYLHCFRGRVNLRRTEIACLTWICQTICGSSFMGNSTYFYEQAGLADSSAFDLTIAQFALGFIGTVLSWPLMARVGRRKIYVWGLFLLTVILFVTGCLGIPPKAASRSWGIGSLLLVYTFTYDITVGPVCYSLVAELPSSRLRQRTIVLARNAYNIVGVAYTNIIGLYSLNPTAWNWGAKSAFFWAGNCALCFVWAYFRLPEPKDRSYAELDMLFDQGVSARKFATTYVNPYETERRSGQDSDSKGKVMSHVE